MGRELRQKLRSQPSVAERRFWRLIHPLRTNGWHFRKQVELGPYYVDFACLSAGLVVEIDDFSHDNASSQNNDALRNDYLRARGFKVLRFSNADVLHQETAVYAAVLAALPGRDIARDLPPPQPSPQGGGCRAGGFDDISP